MSGGNSDLEQFLAILPDLLAEHVNPEQSIDEPNVLAPLRRALDESDISNLALETTDLEDALRWLTATVTTVAHTSPSLSVALAARYTAQRTLHRHAGLPAASSSAGVVSPLSPQGDEFTETVSVSTLFDPELVVMLDLANHRGIVVDRSATIDAQRHPRTGLSDARLQPLQVNGEPRVTLDPAEVDITIREWTLLMSAAAIGIAESARDVSEAYAAERRQFGSALTSFPALRAMLAEMQVQVARSNALLDRALAAPADDAASPAELWAATAPSAVDAALNAIQVHGGYGYIDEYPVAGMLRDALSLRALGGPRRGAIAAVAASRLGPTP
jgi:hypothetical protein